MNQAMRFGRRLALPSTLQIRHELMILVREDVRRADLEKERAEAARLAGAPTLPN